MATSTAPIAPSDRSLPSHRMHAPIFKPLVALTVLLAVWAGGCGGVRPASRRAVTVEVSGARTRTASVAPAAVTSDAGGVGARHARAAHRPAPVSALAPARPDAAASSRAVALWLPYWNMPAALESALAHADVVGVASPFWYTLTGGATVAGDPGAGDGAVVSALTTRGIRVVPTVTESDGLRAFDAALADPARRAALVRALVALAAQPGYSGLDLDFEDFASDPGHAAAPADEAAALYPSFLAAVCAALHGEGRTCTVTVMPRTSAAHVYWRGRLAPWVYDYTALARVADRVRVMAYDEHAPGGPAGPVAPYAWVRRVVAYAAARMPAGKVELGLPAYGYDWSGTEATSFTSREAAPLARQYGVAPTWSAAQAEDTFRYTAAGSPHIVWYEGARAEYVRARLAAAAGFAGIALWAAGGEEAGVWPLLSGLSAG
jgi:spore germination protein